ncbi:zinc finger, CCHC-type containing protein [Tanacetum coccineum]
MWYLHDLTPSNWCKTDVHSTNSGPKIQINILRIFLKLLDSLELNVENRERTRLRLFQFSLRDQASNWVERLPVGSISTWKDLTTRFLARESLSEAWTRFKDLVQKVPHHGIDLWLQVQIFYDHVNFATRHAIDHSVNDKLRDKSAKESWELIENLSLYDLESWNDPRDLAKPNCENVEVYIGKLKLLEDFYIIDMEEDPTCPLLIGRGILATTSAVIDCKKDKITVGKRVTRSVFGVKEIGLGHVDTPYWTTLSKWKSYESQPSTNYIGALPPYYLEKDFMNDHLLGELEIAWDVELNPFKDVLVSRNVTIVI